VAVLTGQIQQTLDDNFQDFAQSWLQALDPTALLDYPALSIAQFNDYQPVSYPGGSELISNDNIRFTTTFPVTLTPLNITAITLESGQTDQLRIDFQSKSHSQTIDCLPIYIDGNADPEIAITLYYALTAGVVDITYSANSAQKLWITHAHLTPDHKLLPNALSTPTNILKDYFAFTPKYYFVNLHGLNISECENNFSITIRFAREFSLPSTITDTTLRLHCVPIINLYASQSEPVKVDLQYHEHPILADDHEHIFQVSKVSSYNPLDNTTQLYQPWFKQNPNTTHYYEYHRRSYQSKSTPFIMIEPLHPCTLSCELLVHNAHLPRQCVCHRR